MEIPERFYLPSFTPSGIERIRLAMLRGHSGDDPDLPIRQVRITDGFNDFVVWHGPVEAGGEDVELWRMEIDLSRLGFPRHSETRAVAGP